jgi:hypothetical protein
LPPGAAPFSKWEDPIVKGVAAAGLSMVSLGFAAFTFLFSALLGIRDAGPELGNLRTKLRHALYGTAFLVLLAAILAVVASSSIAWGLPSLGLVSIVLAIMVLLVICSVTSYIAYHVYREP